LIEKAPTDHIEYSELTFSQITLDIMLYLEATRYFHFARVNGGTIGNVPLGCVTLEYEGIALFAQEG
jgi:hypothetical protein